MFEDRRKFGSLLNLEDPNLTEVRENLEALADQTDVWDAIAKLEQRFERLELLVEGLKSALCAQNILTEHQIAVATTRVDLADGLEDGRIGPLAASLAPPCPSCARPLNPKRAQCIYCGAAVLRQDKAVAPEPKATCARCTTAVPQRTTWYSEDGLLCDPCYRQADDV